MENQHLEELIEKYILKTASTEEQQELLDWYHSQNNNEVIWSSSQLNEGVLVKERLLLNINERIQPKVKSVSLSQGFRTGLRRYDGSVMTGLITAAAVVAIVFGIWFFNASRHPEGSEATRGQLVNDIAPGKNMATLTLANGKVINLSDAKTGVVIGEDLTYNDGTQDPSLAKAISPQRGERSSMMLTASTPRGGTYQVILPDGTKVWLNADSKISFPVQFTDGIRKILLSGEGYFEVAEDKLHPFVVQTDKQTVTVLGTHFNINAYKDEASVKTTLLEGAVKVSSFRGIEKSLGHASSRDLSSRRDDGEGAEDGVVLKPGQQSVVDENHDIKVNDVDVNEFVAWQKGNFIFNGENLTSIMKKLEKWYDIEVKYEEKVTEEPYYGNISRFKNISQVLKMLAAAGDVHFEIKGKKIIVKKAN